VAFDVLVELAPCNIGSVVALIDVGVNCVRRIAEKREQKSNNQLRTADWQWNVTLRQNVTIYEFFELLRIF
jgi:hypothetical protein